MRNGTVFAAVPVITAMLGCQATEEPVDVSSPDTEAEAEVEGATEAVEEVKWADLDEDQVAFLQESATLGEPVGDGTVETTEDPCCSKVESQTYALEPLEGSALAEYTGMLATVTCELTCTGVGSCSQIGCRPSPTFGYCTEFNCGLDCTGTCKQVISTAAATVEALDLAISSGTDSS